MVALVSLACAAIYPAKTSGLSSYEMGGKSLISYD